MFWPNLVSSAARSCSGFRRVSATLFFLVLAEACSTLFTATSVVAEWVAFPLHPADTGATRSGALGVESGTQAGTAFIGGRDHAGTWTGSPNSWTDLHPLNAFDSIAFETHEGRQVGYTTYNGGTIQRAGIWLGTPESWTLLHPAGADNSAALGMGGPEQAGWVMVGSSNPRASLWSGTPESWVDLHPSGSLSSVARRTDGAQQAGYAVITGVTHASLWEGSAGSWVDLHPLGAAWSEAFDVDEGQQVGFARMAMGNLDHAALWTGAANPWVDLNPPGSMESRAHAVSRGRQVGFTDAGGFARRAALWTGSAASVVDLHGVVPGEYSRSQAQDVYVGPTFVAVVGSAYNSTESRNEAMLWVGPGDPTDAPNNAASTDFGYVIAPNPTAGATSLRYALAEPTEVEIAIYDSAGRLVRRFPTGVQSSGSHRVTWDGRNENHIPAIGGVYFMRLRAGNVTASKTIIVVR